MLYYIYKINKEVYMKLNKTFEFRLLPNKVQIDLITKTSAVADLFTIKCSKIKSIIIKKLKNIYM